MNNIKKTTLKELEKAPSGVQGLDNITFGGLPRGRPTLIIGTAGAGKTMFAMEFLVKGVLEYGEPGVFVSFEEKPEELIVNFASMGFDLYHLMEEKKFNIEYIHIERNEIEETGEYDLEGLFIRLAHALDTVKAKRVVLDTLEALFSGFGSESILRAELRRLFGWLKERSMTAIITAEKGKESFTRFGLEEYVADCVIFLDHRVIEQISTRRLRILKYRGSLHGTNEFPFLISNKGITVIPVTSMKLDYTLSSKHISSGIEGLDEMAGGKGFIKGNSILISGSAGTGKTSMCAQFANACGKRGEKCLFFSFEESSDQLIKYMRHIGIDLQPWVDQGLLEFSTLRSTAFGLEMHLIHIQDEIQRFDPELVIIDPISSLVLIGAIYEVQSMMARLLDFLKTKQKTGIYTNLIKGAGHQSESMGIIASLIDTVIELKDIEQQGQYQRYLNIVKSRGTNHSRRVMSYTITSKGFEITGGIHGERTETQ